MKALIMGFKSIVELYMDLKDLTILVGPPSSGKSNILEALAVLGYAYKATLEPYIEGYSSEKRTHIGAINSYIRSIVCHDLLNRFAGASSSNIRVDQVEVQVTCGDDPNTVSISYRLHQNKDKLMVYNIKTRLARPSSQLLDVEEVADEGVIFLQFLSNLIQREKKPGKPLEVEQYQRSEGRFQVIAPRLYGFDRLYTTGNIMIGKTGSLYPVSYLDERAFNLSRILYTNSDILEYINDVLSGLSGVEVMPLSDGRLAFIDRGREVGPSSVSDTVLRILYAYTALLASKPLEKEVEGGIHVRVLPLVMLEEPEAHIYPVAFYNLAEAVVESIAKGNKIVITTHSGRLAQVIWDHARKDGYTASVYYIHRSIDRGTRLYTVNMMLLARQIEDLDLIVNQPSENIDQMVEDNILTPV